MRGHGFPPPSRFWINEPRDGNAFAGEGPTATRSPSTTNYEPGGELQRTAVSPAGVSAQNLPARARSTHGCHNTGVRAKATHLKRENSDAEVPIRSELHAGGNQRNTERRSQWPPRCRRESDRGIGRQARGVLLCLRQQ